MRRNQVGTDRPEQLIGEQGLEDATAAIATGQSAARVSGVSG